MKNIIKQIEKIKGVVTIEKAGENMAVVVFEPKPKKVAVRCDNNKQIEFVMSNGGIVPEDGYTGKVISFGKYVFDNDLDLDWAHFNKPDMFLWNIDFGIGESTAAFWKVPNKDDIPELPKSLSPNELVDGKIYAMEATAIHVFRYKRCKLDDRGFVDHYSYKCENTIFKNGAICVYQSDRILRHATPSEAQSLIRAEIEHGYFHELRDVK